MTDSAVDTEKPVQDNTKNIVEKTFDGVEKLMVHFHRNANQDLVKNAKEIDEVFHYFSDIYSRNMYMQELGFISCKELFSGFANLISPMTKENYQQLKQQASKLLAEKKLPSLKSASPQDEQGRDITVIETFVAQGYRYQDLVKVEPGEVFIDCGAYIGDTAVWAYQNQAAQVYCLDPCPVHWNALKENLQDNNFPALVYPVAVGNQNTSMHFVFREGGTAGAKLIENSQVQSYQHYIQTHPTDTIRLAEVQCVRLDDWFAQNNITPTYIKMDIEGAELDALKGCAETIKKLKPKLAICLYHKKEDMWTIPRYIKSLVPEYKFYCKKNMVFADFVMFATI